MTADFTPSNPAKETVHLTLPDAGKAGLAIAHFSEYSVNSNFLVAADGWSFELGASRLSDDVRAALKCGARVELTINGAVELAGFVDSVEISASRREGTTYRVQGRDRLGKVVDACANPYQVFKQGMTLADVVKQMLGPFGWSSDENFLIDDDEALRDALSGGASRGTPRSKQGKPLKSYVLQQVQPYPREGVFDFLKRIAQRFGLWIWTSSSGKFVIVSTPDFDQGPNYALRRNARGTTNVLDGTVRFDVTDQPSWILVDGPTGGGEFGRGRAKAFAPNPFVKNAASDVIDVNSIAPDARALGFPKPAAEPLVVPYATPVYIHDQDSQSQEQIENVLRRELSLLARRSMTATYTVEGHGQMVNGNTFVPWEVDRTVDVDDEIAGVAERMYVLGRTFQKSRSGGTTTRLELIRLNTIVQ